MASIFGERIPKAAKTVGDKALSLVGLERKRKKSSFFKAARAAISAAQKERWPKLKGKKTAPTQGRPKTKAKKKGKMSAAGRANIVKAQKARWAKIKAEKAAKKG